MRHFLSVRHVSKIHWTINPYLQKYYRYDHEFMLDNGHGIPTETGRARCQRQVAFFPQFKEVVHFFKDPFCQKGTPFYTIMRENGLFEKNLCSFILKKNR